MENKKKKTKKTLLATCGSVDIKHPEGIAKPVVEAEVPAAAVPAAMRKASILLANLFFNHLCFRFHKLRYYLLQMYFISGLKPAL